MSWQTQLDLKMKMEFLNFYQWAYQKLSHQKTYQKLSHQKTYQKHVHYIFVEGHLILIHKLWVPYNYAYLHRNSFSLLGCTLPAFFLPELYLIQVFLLSVKLIIRWVNDHRKSDLLSKQAGSCWCEDTNVSTHLDGSDIGNWLFRHIDAVLSLKKQVRNC